LATKFSVAKPPKTLIRVLWTLSICHFSVAKPSKTLRRAFVDFANEVLCCKALKNPEKGFVDFVNLSFLCCKAFKMH